MSTSLRSFARFERLVDGKQEPVWEEYLCSRCGAEDGEHARWCERYRKRSAGANYIFDRRTRNLR